MIRSIQFVICLCMFFALSQTAFSDEEEENKKKVDGGKYIKIGAITMAGGAALAAIGGANAFDEGGPAAFVVGVGVFGVGIGVLIYGLSHRGNSNSSFREDFKPPAILFGLTPTKGGVAAGAVFRW